MTDTTQIAAEPLRFERTFTTGPDYPSKFTRAYYIYLFSSPRRFVPLLLIIAIFIAIALLSPARGTSWVIPGLYLAVLVVLYTAIYFLTVRNVRARIPAGSVFGVGFRSDTFVMRSPQVTSEVAYSLYKSCERRGNFVVLRQRIVRVASFLPAEIFTDESFEFLRSKITPPTQ